MAQKLNTKPGKKKKNTVICICLSFMNMWSNVVANCFETARSLISIYPKCCSLRGPIKNHYFFLCCSFDLSSPNLHLHWWSIDELENLHADRTTVCFEPWSKLRARLGACKTGLSPPVFLYWPFQGGTSVVVPYCSCCLCLYFGSSIMLVTYFVNFR